MEAGERIRSTSQFSSMRCASLVSTYKRLFPRPKGRALPDIGATWGRAGDNGNQANKAALLAKDEKKSRKRRDRCTAGAGDAPLSQTGMYTLLWGVFRMARAHCELVLTTQERHRPPENSAASMAWLPLRNNTVKYNVECCGDTLR